MFLVQSFFKALERLTAVNRFEKTFGQTAFAHLFVTDAMKMTLAKNWALECVCCSSPTSRSIDSFDACRGQKIVLHDRPPEHFKHSSPAEIHEVHPQSLSSYKHSNCIRSYLNA